MTTESDPRAALRATLRGQRRALSPAERIRGAQDIASRLLDLPFFPTQGYVAGYWALDGEIALHAWQLNLPDDVIFCLPVLQEDGLLKFAPWRAGDPVAHNRFNIPEPAPERPSLIDAREMSLVVMPLVGFDRQGHRLGMGGGWYDRTFAFRNDGTPTPHLVGAAFDAQEMPVDSFVRHPWDVNVDAVCTPTRSLLFGSPN